MGPFRQFLSRSLPPLFGGNNVSGVLLPHMVHRSMGCTGWNPGCSEHQTDLRERSTGTWQLQLIPPTQGVLTLAGLRAACDLLKGPKFMTVISGLSCDQLGKETLPTFGQKQGSSPSHLLYGLTLPSSFRTELLVFPNEAFWNSNQLFSLKAWLLELNTAAFKTLIGWFLSYLLTATFFLLCWGVAIEEALLAP